MSKFSSFYFANITDINDTRFKNLISANMITKYKTWKISFNA